MIAFLGAGNIATALALVLGKRARRVKLYSIEAVVTRSINEHHQNSKYLPDAILPPSVTATDSIEEALKGASFVFVALPSSAVAEVLSIARPHIEPNAIIVSITKGIDPETFHPLILKQIELIPKEYQNRLVILGGPAIAYELASGQVTALVAASEHLEAAEAVQHALSHARVHISLSKDVIGVGLCSALKNAYAIALGLCDGFSVSTNTKGYVYTTALQEIADLVEAAGGQRSTAFTIAGAGDLFVSGNSFHARSRLYGEKLVTSESKQPEDLGISTVEGIAATYAAVQISRKYNLKTPLLTVIAECLARDKQFSQPFERYLQGRVSLIEDTPPL